MAARKAEKRTDPRAPEGKRRNRRSQPLSRERIVEAAVALADDRGDFSMRALGTRLRVDPMAIYRHFRDKDDLLDAMVDAALAGFEPPAPDSGTPLERLRRMCFDFAGAVAAHPGVASRIETTRPTLGPHTLSLSEACLSMLRELGLGPDEAAIAYISLVRFISGVVVAEERARGEGDEAARQEDLRAAYASVPPEQFPNLSSLAASLARTGFEEQLQFGIELILEALARRGAAASSSA
ncbi:MAG: TetR/AcrR family transcriptional regulator [Myxococcota bacterium]|nr:TetR/AcrR family transcriptional regulator [Myxococcota bacterium]